MLKANLKIGRQQRGIAMVIVVAMLFLFAGIGITFSLVARTEANASRGFKQKFPSPSTNGVTQTTLSNDNTSSDHVFENIVSQILYDTNDTRSSLRGHSLLRDMYGGPDADPRANNSSNIQDPIWGSAVARTPTGTFRMGTTSYGAVRPGELSVRDYWKNAFNGAGVRSQIRFNDGDMAAAGPNNGAIVNTIARPFETFLGGGLTAECVYPFNFIEFDDASIRAGRVLTAAQKQNRQPEKYVAGGVSHFFGYDEDYDYPDYNNLFLAMERADGTVIIPSYHRPQLIWDLERRGEFSGATGGAWSHDDGWRVILRPRRREFAGGVGTGSGLLTDPKRNAGVGGAYAAYNGWKDLVDLDGNNVVGDHPSELDVDTDGDGIKDAVWIAFGDKPIRLPDGSYAIRLAAIKTVDLMGRIPINTAGNLVAGSAVGSQGHASNLGASPAEINPKHAHIYEFNTTFGTTFNVLTANSAYLRTFLSVYGFRGRYIPNSTALAASYVAPGTGTGTPGVETGDDSYTQGTVQTTTVNVNVPYHPYFSSLDDYPSARTERLWMRTGINGLDATNKPMGYKNTTNAGINFYGEFDPIWQPTAQPFPYIPAAWQSYRQGTSYIGQRDWMGYGAITLPTAATYSVIPTWTRYERDAAVSTTMANGEPTEFNPYSDDPRTGDSQITDTLMEQFFRFNDIDNHRTRSELVNVIARGVPTDTAGVAQNYGRSRIRRMFTPYSWDLNKISVRPDFAKDATDPASYALDDTANRATVVNATKANRHTGSPDAGVAADAPGTTGFQVADPTLASPYAMAAPVAGVSTVYNSGAHAKAVNPVQTVADLSVFHPWATAGNINLALAPYIGNFNLYPESLLEGTRFNLNRPLRRYRDTTRATGPSADVTNVGAEVDRQILAAQIYMILRVATHCQDGDSRVAQLAQLAVNIVDFMDPDDVLTRFAYDASLNDAAWTPTATVLGFELPRLVVNEGVAFWYEDFDWGSGNRANNTHVFVEMANPYPARPDLAAPGAAADDIDEMQIGWAANNTATINETANLPGTTLLTQVNHRSLAKIWKMEIAIDGDLGTRRLTNDFSDATAKVKANRGRAIRGRHQTTLSALNEDYSHFVVGPDVTSVVSAAATEAFLDQFDITAGGATCDIDYALSMPFISAPDPAGTPGFVFRDDTATPRPTSILVQLKRLRNPYDKEDATFNPYIVMDEFRIAGSSIHTINDTAELPPPATRTTTERQLPWQQNGVTCTNPVGHTLSAGGGGRPGHQNSAETANAAAFVTHYVHFLNRPLASPMELLYVRMFSTYRTGTGLAALNTVPNLPHPLVNTDTDPLASSFTKVFDVTSTASTGPMHTPWFRDQADDTSSPNLGLGGDLFRLFEYVETPTRFVGAGAEWQPLDFVDTTVTPNAPLFRYPDHRSTRVAGKININSTTAEEVFRALIDSDEAQPSDAITGHGSAPPGWTAPSVPAVGTPHIFRDQYPIGSAPTIVDAGTRPDRQVSSEMFKRYLLSLAGQDELLGTLDDHPFGALSRRSISDTILRADPFNAASADPQRRSLDYSDDPSNTANRTAMKPRLFDGRIGGSASVAEPVVNSELYNQNRLLAKIAGNVTTRSTVFATWVTIGYFKVIPGSENLDVPLLDAEVGATDGTNVRRRAFFIFDRSLAPGYTGPQNITDFTKESAVKFSRIIE